MPLPAGAPDPSGSELSTPVVRGSNVAVVYSIGGQPGATAIVTSSDGGRSWRSQLIPGAHRYWNVDLVDPTHWRATDGTVFTATDDAGAHWRTSTPPVAMKSPDGIMFTPEFLTPLVGWAVPGRTSNGGALVQTVDGGVTWTPVNVPGN